MKGGSQEEEVNYEGVSSSGRTEEEWAADLKELAEGAKGMSIDPEGGDGDDLQTPKRKKGFLKGIGKGVKGLLRGATFKKDEDDPEELQKARLHKELALCRHPQAHKDGGLINTDLEGIKMSRSVVAEIVKQVGKKILSGQNLMSVTFPVRCCQPRSILECAAYQFVYCPHYLTKAAASSDPVERMKQAVCCFVACIHTTSQFVKPFNPTLGETLQATFQGGTQLFMEQTSHHPPVTSWLLTGAGDSYRYYGWSTYEASFGVNKLYVKQSGVRLCEFADGSVIDVGFSMDRYNNVYWGDLIQEMVGGYQFRDTKSGIQCTIELNPYKELPSDVFVGSIDKIDAEGESLETLCQVEGSWLGYLDFDNVRYWDFKSDTRTDPVMISDPLPSDSRFRDDRNALAGGDVDKAQIQKTVIEDRQRRERRLRAAAQKALESGGGWDSQAAADVK